MGQSKSYAIHVVVFRFPEVGWNYVEDKSTALSIYTLFAHLGRGNHV